MPFSLLFIFCVPFIVASQHLPIKISLINEATAIPFNKLFTTPIHPGIQAGTEFTYKEKKHQRLYQSANIGYIFHNHLFHGIYINTELGFDYKLNFGLNIKSQVGLGYLRSFATQKQFGLKNGSYQPTHNKSTGHAMINAGLGLGYRLKRKEQTSPEIFTLYQGWIEYPFSPGFIPVMPHTNFQVGFKFFLTHK